VSRPSGGGWGRRSPGICEPPRFWWREYSAPRLQQVVRLSIVELLVSSLGPLSAQVAAQAVDGFGDAASLSVTAGALSLHDGTIPVRRAGLGTRRLYAVAMQRAAAAQTGLTLVDEFEHGLEPHRIRRLLRVLRGKPPENGGEAGGQLVFSTHSPTVLSELVADEVFVTRRDRTGGMVVGCVPRAVDYVLARTPEALLAQRVVVAEGATELGFCCALDERWTAETGISFAYRGMAVVDGGGGTQPAEIAGHLAALGYTVALLIDSDARPKAGRARGASVLAWPGGVSTEERLAMDLPKDSIRHMTRVAASSAKKGIRSVRDALTRRLGVARTTFGEDPEVWVDAVAEPDFRSALGSLAKQQQHGWFKTRENGAFLGRLVASNWEALLGTPTRQLVDALRTFTHDG